MELNQKDMPKEMDKHRDHQPYGHTEIKPHLRHKTNFSFLSMLCYFKINKKIIIYIYTMHIKVFFSRSNTESRHCATEMLLLNAFPQ